MKTYKSFTALVLIAALLASCSGKKDKKGQNVDETPLVELQSVHSEDVEELSEYTATVEAFKTNNISSSTGNRIKRILVDVGSNVSRTGSCNTRQCDGSKPRERHCWAKGWG